MTKFLSKNRRYFQVLIGLAIYILVSHYQISLWWVLALGSVLGIIWGKVFCRWMCPIGMMMEFVIKMNPNESFRNMYQYHKVGCPIAWISGLLNKISFYKIQLNRASCKDCGLCDQACYMTKVDTNKFSLYKSKLLNPAENFSCSKCLSCVTKCPNGSLSFKPTLPFINKTN